MHEFLNSIFPFPLWQVDAKRKGCTLSWGVYGMERAWGLSKQLAQWDDLNLAGVPA